MPKILDGDVATINQLVAAPDPYPFKLWKDGFNNNWSPHSINMSKDIEQWKSKKILTDDERLLVQRVLGFFSGGESLVGNNLVLSVYRYVTDGGCRQYLGRQIFEETLHNATIAVCCEAYALDEHEVAEAYRNIPEIKAKDDFLMQITSDLSRRDFDITTDAGKTELLENIFAFYLICEGTFFYSGFAMALSLGRQNKMVGLCDQIRYTLRDESLHIQFGTYLINKIKEQYPHLWTKELQDRLVARMQRAVELEIEYSKACLPNGVLGLNADMFVDYMKFIGNRRLEGVDLPYRFDSNKNPFSWMGEVADVQTMGAFFERKERSYQNEGALVDDL